MPFQKSSIQHLVVLALAMAFLLGGCAMDLASAPASSPAASLDGEIYKAQKDVDMYEEILNKQIENRKALQKKIENTSIWDKFKRTANNMAAISQLKTSQMEIGLEQEHLEIMDRQIRQTRRNLDYSKKKLEDLKKQQEGGGGGGGGGSC